MNGFAFHPEAVADLDEIWDYLAPHNLAAAAGVVADIFDALSALVQFPLSGHRRPDLTSRPLRFFGVREFLIVYAPDERPL